MDNIQPPNKDNQNLGRTLFISLVVFFVVSFIMISMKTDKTIISFMEDIKNSCSPISDN